MNLIGRDGPVLDAARDDQKLPFFQPERMVPKIHSESPLDDQEQLILVLMMMPDKLSLEFDQLDVLAVQIANDPRIPVVVEQAEFFLDVYFLHLLRFLIRAHVV